MDFFLQEGDVLKIYCEKVKPSKLRPVGGDAVPGSRVTPHPTVPSLELVHEPWDEWMDLFLYEGNLLWVIEEVGEPQEVKDSETEFPLTSEITRHLLRQKGLKMRLINPENLNEESINHLDIDLTKPIICNGSLHLFEQYNGNLICYYENARKGELFDKLFDHKPKSIEPYPLPFIVITEFYGGRIPEHGETPEENEFKDIIEILKNLWGNKNMSDFFDFEHPRLYGDGDEISAELKRLTKEEGGEWEDFLRTAWDKGFIPNLLLKHYKPGDYVYDKVKGYVELNSATAAQAQAADMGDALMADPVETMEADERKDAMIAMAGYGGGRKKRRKRRKTKRKSKRSSKRKSKRSSKKRKSKKK